MKNYFINDNNCKLFGVRSGIANAAKRETCFIHTKSYAMRSKLFILNNIILITIGLIFLNCHGNTDPRTVDIHGFGSDKDTILRKEYYNNGRLKFEMFVMKVDTMFLHGPYSKYYNSGQLAAKGLYRNNKPHGKFVGFHENGNLKYEMVFNQGEKVSLHKYNADGNLIRSERYTDGTINDTVRIYHDDGTLFALQLWDKGYKLREESYSNGNDLIRIIEYKDKHIDNFPEDELDFAPFKVTEFYNTNDLGGIKEVIYFDVNQMNNGEYKYYHNNGSIKVRGSYNHGEKDGEWGFYDKKSNLIKKQIWNLGELIEEKSFE